VADVLADRLDTRVQVTMGKSKGRVTIEFAGREDLERILEVLTSPRTPT
jgi:ParB family chromosome partitioning protein